MHRLAAGFASCLAALGLAACAPPATPVRQEPGRTLAAEAVLRWRVFSAEIREIDDAARARMSSSWRPGCPVELAALRLLELDHWGYDGAVHRGELVVHADWAQPVVEVFRKLFTARFQIERLRLVDEYGGDDDASMGDNNSSGFNCREVAGSPGVWSEHAYGRAIDLNPVQNPFVSRNGTVSPPAGQPYADRTASHPGMIRSGDAVVEAFAAIGWTWGGDWTTVKDYQHFSSTGR